MGRIATTPQARANTRPSLEAAPLLNVLILGAGSVVTEYYLPALAGADLAATVTVADPEEAGLAAVRAVLPSAQTLLQDFREVLYALPPVSNVRHELVIVTLPNQLHIEACELALSRGRNVLCEKPLSLSARDCRRVGQLAAANGVRLTVAMVRRWLPSWMLARQIIAAGELGTITAVEAVDCALFGWRPRSLGFFAPGAGGVLADMGIHYLDFLDDVLGPMTPVAYEDDWRGGNESNCTFQLSAGDVPVRLVLSRTHPGGTLCRFVGSKSTLTIAKSDELHVVLEPTGLACRRLSLVSPFSQPDRPAGLHGSFVEMLAEHRRTSDGAMSTAATAAHAERASGLVEWAYAQRSAEAWPSRSAGPVAQPLAVDTLITGGSGFIGGHLVDRLASQGASISCVVRQPHTVANLARYPVQMRRVDLLDRQAVAQSLQGIRHVYHLAYGRDGADAAAVTVEGTRNLVEAAIAAGVECVVVLSTAYVFGFPDTAAPIDETFPYIPYGGEYAASKSRMERWCLDRARSSGETRIVVLNPTNVFGPEGGAYTLLPLKLARSGGFCWVDGGIGLCNYTYVENLVDAIIAASSEPRAHGERFIISDGAKPWSEFLGPFVSAVGADIASYTQAELEKFGRAAPGFRFADLAKAIAASSEVRAVARRSDLVRRIGAVPQVRRLLKPQARSAHPGQRPVQTGARVSPPPWIAELYHSKQTVFSARHATEVLGWVPRVTWEVASERTLAWLRSSGYLDP